METFWCIRFASAKNMPQRNHSRHHWKTSILCLVFFSYSKSQFHQYYAVRSSLNHRWPIPNSIECINKFISNKLNHNDIMHNQFSIDSMLIDFPLSFWSFFALPKWKNKNPKPNWIAPVPEPEQEQILLKPAPLFTVKPPRPIYNVPQPQHKKPYGIPKPIKPTPPEIHLLPYDQLPKDPQSYEAYLRNVFNEFMEKYQRAYINVPGEREYRFGVFAENYHAMNEFAVSSSSFFVDCVRNIRSLSKLLLLFRTGRRYQIGQIFSNWIFGFGWRWIRTYYGLWSKSIERRQNSRRRHE